MNSGLIEAKARSHDLRGILFLILFEDTYMSCRAGTLGVEKYGNPNLHDTLYRSWSGRITVKLNNQYLKPVLQSFR